MASRPKTPPPCLDLDLKFRKRNDHWVYAQAILDGTWRERNVVWAPGMSEAPSWSWSNAREQDPTLPTPRKLAGVLRKNWSDLVPTNKVAVEILNAYDGGVRHHYTWEADRDPWVKVFREKMHLTSADEMYGPGGWLVVGQPQHAHLVADLEARFEAALAGRRPRKPEAWWVALLARAAVHHDFTLSAEAITELVLRAEHKEDGHNPLAHVWEDVFFNLRGIESCHVEALLDRGDTGMATAATFNHTVDVDIFAQFLPKAHLSGAKRLLDHPHLTDPRVVGHLRRRSGSAKLLRHIAGRLDGAARDEVLTAIGKKVNLHTLTKLSEKGQLEEDITVPKRRIVKALTSENMWNRKTGIRALGSLGGQIEELGAPRSDAAEPTAAEAAPVAPEPTAQGPGREEPPKVERPAKQPAAAQMTLKL